MRISHEAIYQSLFIQGRGALKRELVTCLRTGRALRRPRARAQNRPQGHVTADVMFSERPAEAADRAVPGHWDEICRLTASLRAGTVVPSAILRTLQRGPNPSSLARALAELGRVIKTLHVLEYAHDPAYRRSIHHMLSRGERRNALARDVFHGQRGQLRRHYQVGQENQLDSLGLMVNLIALWQTVYMQAALDHLSATRYEPDPADIARLTPLGHPTINLDGRYRTTSRPPTTGLRPLRTGN